MNIIKEKKNRILKLMVCLVVMCGVFASSAMPVAASNIFSKTVNKAAGKWSGTAKHASTFVKISYGCKKVASYRDTCTDSVALSGQHRARIKNASGTAFGPKKPRGINSSITTAHEGKKTYFQSEYSIR